MGKYLIVYTPNTTTEEFVVEADSEDDALFNWENTENIISKKVIKHGDGYIHVEKIEE